MHGRAWTWIFPFLWVFGVFGCCLTHVLGTCYFVMRLVDYLQFELKTFYLEKSGRRSGKL